MHGCQAIKDGLHRRARTAARLAGGTLDRGNTPFPIYRDAPDDSDHENTTATGVFVVVDQAVDWMVHIGGQRESSIPMRDAARSTA